MINALVGSRKEDMTGLRKCEQQFVALTDEKKYKKCEEIAKVTKFNGVTFVLMQMCINFLLYGDNEILKENQRLKNDIKDLEQEKRQMMFEYNELKKEHEKAQETIAGYIVEVANE